MTKALQPSSFVLRHSFDIRHSSFGRRAACGLLPRCPLTACRHVVSGSLSSPCRGSSHLSLALLRSLSVAREYLALRDGPRRFRPSSTWTVLLRCRTGGFSLSHTGLSPTMVELPRTVLLGKTLVTPMCPVLQPHPDESEWFGLVR